MALIDMTLSKEEAKEESYLSSPSDDNLPRYPWGLSLCLDDDTLKKLGVGMMAVGTQMTLTAQVIVTGTRSSQNQGGDSEQSMDLQITAMEINSAAPAKSAADALYGSN